MPLRGEALHSIMGRFQRANLPNAFPTESSLTTLYVVLISVIVQLAQLQQFFQIKNTGRLTTDKHPKPDSFLW